MCSLKMFSIREILDATKGRLFKGNLDNRVTGVSIDSRTIRKGEVFFAIKGMRFDGHNFIEEAIHRGASAVVVQKAQRLTPSPLSITPVFIEVPDTIMALGDLAHFYHKRFSIPVVAITGSCGKTTTKEMLAHILSHRYKVLKNEGTRNNQIGIPLTLLSMNAPHQMVVLEFGTNHPGEIKRLSEIGEPTIGIITNIGPSHLEFLIDIEGVLHEKWSLIQSLPRDRGLAILNGDDPFLRCLPQALTFGIENECDITAKNITYTEYGSTFSVGDVKFCLNLLGRHNIYNALATIGCASKFGLDYYTIQKRLESFTPVQMRLIPIMVNGFTILDDTYNSNPLSMQAALEVLKNYPTRGRRILVVGDMLELGKKSFEYHRQIGKMAKESGIHSIVAVGRLCTAIKDAMRFYGSPAEVAEYLIRYAEAGDTLLVKGSRIMRMEQIIRLLSCDAISSTLSTS